MKQSFLLVLILCLSGHGRSFKDPVLEPTWRLFKANSLFVEQFHVWKVLQQQYHELHVAGCLKALVLTCKQEIG